MGKQVIVMCYFLVTVCDAASRAETRGGLSSHSGLKMFKYDGNWANYDAAVG